MNVSDLIVEVRDRDLTRKAQLSAADLATLVVVARDSDVGSWEIALPDSVLDETTGKRVPHAAALALRQEGAGLIVSSEGEPIPASPAVIGPGPVDRRNMTPRPRARDGGWVYQNPLAPMRPPSSVEITNNGVSGDSALAFRWTAGTPGLVRVLPGTSMGSYVDPTGLTHLTASIDVYFSPEVTCEMILTFYIPGQGEHETVLPPPAAGDWDGWSESRPVRYTAAVPVPAGATLASLGFTASVDNPATSAVVSVSRVMLSPWDGVSTPDFTYMDGDTLLDGYQHAWTGAVNDSASTRAPIVELAPAQPSQRTTATILSGPMTSATYEGAADDPDGRWVFAGVSDNVLLADALAYPDPANGNPSTQTRANDKRTGTAESLLRQFVGFNICNGTLGGVTWAPAARLTGLRNRLALDSTNLNQGASMTKSPRFQNLLELCREIGFAGGVRFDIAQAGDRLVFKVSTPRDRSGFVRMDVQNDLLKSVTYGYGGPSTTVAVVAGQGEGSDRTIVSRSSTSATAAESTWGRRIERFIDQRNTNEADELNQAGDEAVAEGAAVATGLQAVPTDSGTMLFIRDWFVGDVVAVSIDGQEVKAPVSEVALSVSGADVVIVATLGEASAFDVEAASQRREEKTLSRLSALERTAEGVPARIGPVAAQVADADAALTSGRYWLPTTGTNGPSPGVNFVLQVDALPSDSVYQSAARIGSPTADVFREEWARVRFANGTWSAWSLLNKSTTTFTPTAVTGMALGNGTVVGRYEVANAVLNGRIRITLGSSTSITGDLIMALPLPMTGSAGLNIHDGSGRLNMGGTALFDAVVLMTSSGVYIRTLRTGGTGGTYLVQTPLGPSVPAAWAAGHVIDVAFSYPIA